MDLSITALSVNSALTSEANEGLPKLDIDSKDLQGLHSCMDGMVTQYRALLELQNLMDQQRASAKDIYRPPLGERLEEYPLDDVDLTNLVNFPPKLQPIPVKPLFFDLAWNYIDYPGRVPPGVNGAPMAPKAAADEKKEPTKKGWFGFGR